MRALLRPFRYYVFDQRKVGQVLILTAIFTALQRPWMETAPMFVVNGAMPGTGKGHIARAISHLAFGTAPVFMAFGVNEEEFAKRFDGLMMMSPAMFVIDNANGKMIRGDTLEMMITEGRANIRPLGSSDQVSVRNRSFMMATGNNVSISGDMNWRALMIDVRAKS
jgi:hypothetical protein